MGAGFGPGLGKSLFCLSFFPSEAVVWFHITSCWHMLSFKPIRVFIHVWSDWPMPLWRGWPHASLSPILWTIWQRGAFLSFLSVASPVSTGLYSISSSHLLVSISLSIRFLFLGFYPTSHGLFPLWLLHWTQLDIFLRCFNGTSVPSASEFKYGNIFFPFGRAACCCCSLALSTKTGIILFSFLV